MAIERLKKDTKCSECGTLLKAGTRAKVYRRSDGKVLVYGFDCHARKEQSNGEVPPREGFGSDALAEALANIQRALWTIVELLRRAQGEREVPTEQVLDEIAEEAGQPPTQKDWARFWGTIKRLGLDRDSVHEYLGVESVKEVVKTAKDLDELLERIKQDLAF